MNLTLEKARLLFKSGALKEPTAVHAPINEDKFMLMMEIKQETGWATAHLVSKRGKIREFPSLEAAKTTVESIGFKADRVKFI
jgi:hypothetical protein